MVAPGRRDRTEVHGAAVAQQCRCLGRVAGGGAEGRCAPRQARAAHRQGAVRADPRARLPRQLRAGVRLGAALACAAGRGAAAGRVRAAGVCPGRSVPVRLELRVRLRRRTAAAARGGAYEARGQPRLLAGGLSDPEPRDAVRCARAGLRRLRRRAPARHLRQHEDGGGCGRPRQGARRQRALRRHVLALPVRARVLQPRRPAGRRARSRRTCSTGAARSGAKPPSGAGRTWRASTPGWPSAAARCGARRRTPSGRR